ncbi:flippase [uncultured Maribacter sp.]|uniref:flippase n=1 Tax=uncultured Maribacter sp. TaxID=431308 RepID=UPI00262F0CE1|nr:flippase [uncultured Maribacter sp.]
MIDSLVKFVKSEGFKKYFANTSWVIGEKILRIIAALVISVWVARYLGPDDFGTLNYAQSLVGLLTAISTLGLNGILVREILQNKVNTNKLIGTVFILQTIGSVVIMLSIFLFIYFTETAEITSKILIIFGAITFLQSFNVIESFFQSKVLSKYTVKSSVISLIISSILKILLIVYKFPLIYFAIVMFIENLVLVFGYVHYYNKKNDVNFSFSFSIKLAKSLLKDSWPLILSSIVVSIYMKIDQVMIKEMISSKAVGFYSAAVRLSEAWYFVPTVIGSSLFPAIMNAKKNSTKVYYERLQNLYDLMFLLAIVIAIPISLISKPLVQFLYGTEYLQSSEILTIHIWTGIFVFLGVSRSGWIIAENLQKFSTIYLSIGMVTNVTLNYIFINNYGITGAAYATLISQSVSVLFAPLIFKETRISFTMMFKSITLSTIIKKIFKK